MSVRIGVRDGGSELAVGPLPHGLVRAWVCLRWWPVGLEELAVDQRLDVVRARGHHVLRLHRVHALVGGCRCPVMRRIRLSLLVVVSLRLNRIVVTS